MSGWSAITVEPRGVPEDNFPEEDEVRYLGDLVEDALNGYKDESVNELETALDKLEQQVEELQMTTGDVDVEKCVIDFIEENYELRGESPIIPRDPPTFQPGYRGLAGKESKAREYAHEIFEGCPYAKRVLIISANDTSDSGQGILFRREEDDSATPVKVDYKSGYEGARGRDVTGYFRDEYHISGTASVY